MVLFKVLWSYKGAISICAFGRMITLLCKMCWEINTAFSAVPVLLQRSLPLMHSLNMSKTGIFWFTNTFQYYLSWATSAGDWQSVCCRERELLLGCNVNCRCKAPLKHIFEHACMYLTWLNDYAHKLKVNVWRYVFISCEFVLFLCIFIHFFQCFMIISYMHFLVGLKQFSNLY